MILYTSAVMKNECISVSFKVVLITKRFWSPYKLYLFIYWVHANLVLTVALYFLPHQTLYQSADTEENLPMSFSLLWWVQYLLLPFELQDLKINGN